MYKKIKKVNPTHNTVVLILIDHLWWGYISPHFYLGRLDDPSPKTKSPPQDWFVQRHRISWYLKLMVKLVTITWKKKMVQHANPWGLHKPYNFVLIWEANLQVINILGFFFIYISNKYSTFSAFLLNDHIYNLTTD